MAVVNWSLQHFSDTAANMTANNPVLLEGQIGIETDGLTTTPKFKIGDGSTAWNTLPYFYGGALSAQNLSNVLGVGNTTGNNDIIQTGSSVFRNSDSTSFLNLKTTSYFELYSTDATNRYEVEADGGSQYAQLRVHDIATELETTYFQCYPTTAQWGVFSATAGNRQVQMQASITGIEVQVSNFAAFAGIQYINDHSANYTNRSLVDKGYVTGNFQPLNSNLTSWAGVTRASGFDTFVATPSSANLRSLVTDETGSGALVFGTSPTFTTDITTPKVLTNGVQVVYLPNQANYVGSLFIGNGGANIDNTGVDAGDYNTYIGIGSGFATTIAKRNTAVGYNTLAATTSGWANTAVGYNTLSTGIGTGSLAISGAGNEFYANTGVGEGVMSLATTASYNTGIGVNSLNALTTGIMNTGVGVHALQSVQTGSYNCAIGKESLYNYTDSNSVAMGHTAGWSKVSGSMLAIGYQAGYSDVSTGANTFIGNQAGYYQKNGYYMTIVGYQAAFASANKSGYYHTIMGYRAGYQLGNCEGNTLIGYQSGYSKTTGDYNTFIGHDAGNNASQLATAGNSTAIGYGAYTTASNQIVFGNANVTQHIFRAGSVLFYQGADVASANNLVVSNGNVFEITGTTQINLISNLTWQNGSQITLLFASTPTVKHNQATSTTNITIQLAGAVDFAATAGDTLTLVLSEIGGTQAWREVSRAVI